MLNNLYYGTHILGSKQNVMDVEWCCYMSYFKRKLGLDLASAKLFGKKCFSVTNWIYNILTDKF